VGADGSVPSVFHRPPFWRIDAKPSNGSTT
jgi:hypothetical protein